MNSELYNFVIHDSNNTNIIYGSNYHSLMLSERQQQQQQSFDDSYTALILEGSKCLYNRLTRELTDWSIAATATIRESSLLLPTHDNNRI